MNASAADVRSILSLPTPSTSAGPATAAAPKPKGTRKPEGISRELFALIGPNAPSLVAAPAKPRLKAKPNLGGGAAAKWVQREFANGARSDGMKLSHWVKESEDPNADYRFAKYNVENPPMSYTEEEYTKYLQNESWTKEETDYLFELMKGYDLRWYVVHDRYDFPGGPPRTLEDLKDRYCSICRKLLRNRPWSGDEARKTQLMSTFNFEKERETMRKKYLSSLASRTPAQLAEEEALFLELKRLEQTERRYKRERDDLLRTLLGVDAGLADLAFDEDGGNGSNGTEGAGGIKKRKRGATLGSELDSTPATPSIGIGGSVARRAGSVQTAKYDATHCIHRMTPPPPPTAGSAAPATKTAHQPVYLRSYKLPLPKSALAPKIAQALVELGVPVVGPGFPPPPSGPGVSGDKGALAGVAGVFQLAPAGNVVAPRLVMPTRANCARLERLMDAVGALVETKRACDRVDQDARVAKSRMGMKEEDGEDGAQGSAEGRSPEGEEESTSGRGMSVVSSVSAQGEGRGRRQRRASRRSMSMSSVDTTATGTTVGAGMRKRGRK